MLLGDKGLKALVQLLSASIAKLQALHFYTFGDKDFHQKFSSVLQLLNKKQLKVGHLWNMIQQFKEELDSKDDEARNLNCILEWIIETQSC